MDDVDELGGEARKTGRVSRRHWLLGAAATGSLPVVAVVAACGSPAGGQTAVRPAALDLGATVQLLIDLGAAVFPLFEGVVTR